MFRRIVVRLLFKKSFACVIAAIVMSAGELLFLYDGHLCQGCMWTKVLFCISVECCLCCVTP